MKTLTLILSLLALTPLTVQAKPVDVQVVYAGNRSPRPMVNTAKVFLKDTGIPLRFTFKKIRRVPRFHVCGTPLFFFHLKRLSDHTKKNTKTILLTPPPKYDGKEELCGVALVCGNASVVTWGREKPNVVLWVFIHELAHLLGAHHTEESSFLSPMYTPSGWQWSQSSVQEMKACTGR